MKVLNFVSVALLGSVLAVSTAFGNNGLNVKNSNVSVRDQIGSTLSNINVESNGEVYIYFNVSGKDGFKLLKVTGSDENLVKEVKNQLQNQNFVIPEGTAGSFYLKVSFKNGDVADNSLSDEELLRKAVTAALATVNVPNGTVTLHVTVDGNRLKVNKVDGNDQVLVSEVENTFNKSAVFVPTELTYQNYQMDIKF